MAIQWKRWMIVVVSLCIVGFCLWILRSWNLVIGDGEFCCKQTIAESAFAVTLSRAPLSYLLYRGLFFSLHPILNWWVEDIIALSSCVAGIVFFFAVYSLARQTSRSSFEFWIIFLFPSTTLLLQIFCGHVEFYPWTCTLLAVSALLAWKSIADGWSPLWASGTMALAAAFHSSGVFYFPALLLLPPFFTYETKNKTNLWCENRSRVLILFFLFILTALLHRTPTYFWIAIAVAMGIGFLFRTTIQEYLAKGWEIYIPWFVLFAVRAFFGLRAEPLIEHLPPVFEPYDHGAYLYEAFSWDHLYDKTMFHFWLAPFGLIALLLFGWRERKKITREPWLLFLSHFCLWTLVWTVLFYPQLRTRDWDLFATMSIPFNLFAVYAFLRFLPVSFQRTVIPMMILAHLTISLPVVIKNSHLLEGRGYVTLTYSPTPAENRAFLRGLQVGITPLTQPNVRSGWAEIRIVPLERGLHSWAIHQDLIPGNHYLFDPILPSADHPIPPPP